MILFRYETTATSLSFASYLIAAHPEVQDQIFEEIDKVEVEKVISSEVKLFTWFNLGPHGLSTKTKNVEIQKLLLAREYQANELQKHTFPK